MTPKPLEEEVAELERFYAGEPVRNNLNTIKTILRLIADWRARDERDRLLTAYFGESDFDQEDFERWCKHAHAAKVIRGELP